MGIAGAIVGGAVITAGVGAASSSAAASAQKKAARSAAAQQQRMFDEQVRLQEPFRQAGMEAKDELLQLLGLGGDNGSGGYGAMTRKFGMSQFRRDPGYEFRQAEGMKALERSAAARGNLLSGSTLKGIERFGQDLASQDQNAFNRYQIERSARLNPLQSLMGAGQSATNIMTGAAGQLGQGLAQSEMAAGQARASGYMGIGNAINQGVGNVTNYLTQAPLYNAMANYYNNGAPGGGAAIPGYNGGIGGGAPVYNSIGMNS